MIGKIISGLVGGLILAVLSLLVMGIATAGDRPNVQSGTAVFFITWVAALVVALTAPRAAKAWRRLLVTAGIFSFAIPVATFVFTGTMVSRMATKAGEHASAAAAGALLGGGMVTVMAGILGFFLGLIFLVIGLVVGRDKEIVVIREGDPGLP